MATIQFSQTVSVELPDSQVKKYLEKFEGNQSFPYDVVINENVKEYTTKSQLEIEHVDWDTPQIESIEKQNGSTYYWDGESLEKE